LGRVSRIHGLGLDLENFPSKCQIIQFFLFRSKKISSVVLESTWVKGGLASFLLQVKNMLLSCQVRAHLYEKVYQQSGLALLESKYKVCNFADPQIKKSPGLSQKAKKPNSIQNSLYC